MLLKHAKAKPKDVDPKQPLTVEGAESFRRVAEHIAKLNINLGNIYHSGKLRATQTVEILAEETGKTISVRHGLDPTEDVKPTAKWLDEQKAERVDAVTIIGHLPFLERLTSILTSGGENAEIVPFHNGGVVELRKKRLGRRFSIDWIILPEIL
ncbi:MAG: phosphohistidine phosphatase SixA [Candidatus Bathyarchaeia archaeon]